MSETPNYIAQVRFRTRWHHWTKGDVAAFPLATANDLVARQIADGLPPPPGTVPVEGAAPAKRVPESVVRK